MSGKALVRQTLAYLPAQFLGPLTQLGAALLLTHALGAADYGLVMLIFAAQELVFLVCLSWWTTFYLRYGSRAVPGGAGLASTEAAVLLWSALAQAAVTCAIVLATEPGLSLIFYASACGYTLSRSVLSFLGERARREAAIGAYTAVQLLGPMGGLALVGLLMFVGALGPSSQGVDVDRSHGDAARVLLAFAATQAMVALAIAARMGLLVRPQALDRAVLRAAARFGAPVVLANGLSWFSGNVIRFVVHHGAGAVALGWMSVGWGLATRLAGVAAMLVSAAAYPLAIKAMDAGDVAGARRQIAHNSVLLLALLAPAVLLFWALAPGLVPALVALPYQAVTLQILPWALLGAAVRNLRLHGWDQTYLLFESPRDMLVLDVVEAIGMTAAAMLGLWWQGMAGAVAASAWATVLLAVFDAAWLRHRFGLKLPLAAYARVLVAVLALAALWWAAQRLGWRATPQAGPLLGAALAGGVLYAAVLAAMFPRQSQQGWRL